MKRSGSSLAACRRFIIAVIALIAADGAWADDCPVVKTGFSGDTNQVYNNDYGGGGGGGDAGTGGDTGGDAGAGAGEGKVLGGLMTVARLSDGEVLGSALTDSETGLVTIRVCQGDLPVLLTLSGQAGAQYFDEATGRLTDFGPGNVLHALIDSFVENIGVSPLTEASYRYALNNDVLNPDDVRAGRVPLASSGNVAGLTLAQVATANNVVLREVNRLQSADMQLVSIKSLPTPIDSSSNGSALPDNRYGVAAAVLGGLVKMGVNYGISSQNPAIDVGEQLARDLTDGRIDGFALDGQPAAGVGVPVAYDLIRLPIAASVGANDISARFGAATTLLRATDITEQTFAGPSTTTNSCTGSGETASLMKDGSITLMRTTCGGAKQPVLENFATNVALIEGAGAPNAARTFFVKTDGTVWGWGDTLCGLLGNGETSVDYHPDPVQIQGMGRVTSIANGVWFTVARDDTGSVYTWGLNYIDELGLGSIPPGSSMCENDYTRADFRSGRTVSVPTKIAGLTNIVAVAADGNSPIALDKDGTLFEWGLIPKGWDFTKPQADYPGEYDTQPIPLARTDLPQKAISVAVSYTMKMALTTDRTLWGWGPNIVGNFGDGTKTPHPKPTQVPGLTDVVEIAASLNSPFVALLKDGTVRYWGGCCLQSNQSIPAYIQQIPTQPPQGATAFYSKSTGKFFGTLPPIRHIKGSGGQVLLYGSDGTLLQFPKSSSENTFVVLDAPALSYQGLWWNSQESGWGINLTHQGDIIFATWFTYDTTGKAWWLSMIATKTGPGVYSGTINETHGPPFNVLPFNPAAVSTNAVGLGKLSFPDSDNGTFQYTVNGVTQTKAITRELLAALPVCTFGATDVDAATSNYQGLWWASPPKSESGWGVNFTHQGDMIFATWFTYDTDGTPLWLSGLAKKSGDRAYFGALYKTSGPAFSAMPFDSSRVTATSVGSFSLQFDANATTGQFTYTVNGVTQTKPIIRETFSSPVTVCH